jgi:hypothetical protein
MGGCVVGGGGEAMGEAASVEADACCERVVMRRGIAEGVVGDETEKDA